MLSRRARMGTIIKWIFVLSLSGISLSKSQKRQYATACLATDFQCKNDECIGAPLRCDGVANCIDGSDECGCQGSPGPTTNPAVCTDSTYIQCADGYGCYPPNWKCDNYDDCLDKSDEAGCTGTPGPTTNPAVCTDSTFIQCADGYGCYPPNWKCDNYDDCLDKSDEAGCTGGPTPGPTGGPTGGPSPSPGQCANGDLQCADGNGCYPSNWKCDTYDDCEDKSDEANCQGGPTPGHTGGPTGGPSPSPGQCANGYLQCADGNGCYPPNWKCDNYDDCQDKSDEANCQGGPTPGPTGGPTGGPSPSPGQCANGHLQCADGNGCYPPYWKCDNDDDCQDKSDEANCQGGPTPGPTGGPTGGLSPSPGQCANGYLQCADGNGCYPPNWKCDNYDDCQDKSDEANCQGGPTPGPTGGPTGGPSPSPGQCANGYLQCADWNGCYPPNWKCDNYDDCQDKSDEANCQASTGGPTPGPTGGPTGGPSPSPGQCANGDLQCADGNGCYPPNWKCDNYDDCQDKSDEANCQASTAGPTGGPSPSPGQCANGDLQCADGNGCYPPNWKCDNYDDCQDKSDEDNCPAPTTAAPPTPTCGQESSKCDGSVDCTDRSDEQGCDTFTCPAGKVKCGSSGDDNKLCVPETAFCDGYQDCPDGGDEEEFICKARTCDASEFRCSDGACLPGSVKCNGWPECKNGDDESGCSGCPNTDLYRRCTDGKLCVEKSSFCDNIKDCADNSDESGCGVNPSKRSMLLRRFERLLNSLRSRERRSAMRHPMSVAQRALRAMNAGRQRKHLTLAERRAHVRASVVRHPVNRRRMESISREHETMRRRSQIRHDNLRRLMYQRHISDEIRKHHKAEARRHLMKSRRG